MAGFNLPDSLVTSDILTQTRWQKIPDSVAANAFTFIEMGGSRSIALSTGGGYIAIPDWRDFSLPGSAQTGHTYKLVWEVLTENAATTVTLKLRNITDSSDAYAGSAISTTAWGTEQVSTAITIATGKVYRVQASKSDDLFDCWLLARLRRTHA